MPDRGLNGGPALEHLSTAGCWTLLASRSFGRLCLYADGRVQVSMTAFAVRDDAVYFRATAFGPVARLAPSRPVTLQVDDIVDDQRAGWSVTVTGRAERVTDAATLASLWTPVRPLTWDAGAEPIWMSLTGDDVRGLRVRGAASGP